MKTIHLCISAFILVAISGQCSAALKPGEDLIRDPVTGNYTAHFWRETEKGGRLVKATFATATKIEPAVRSRMSLTNNWNVKYAYKLSNGANAKQPILSMDIFGLPANTAISNSDVVTGRDNVALIEFFETSLTVPNSGWSGSGARIPEELNIGWHHNNRVFDTTLGIKPGESLGGFELLSSDIPGIWKATLLGNTKYHHFSFSGESPDAEDTDLADQMEDIVANDFVSRNVAAPMIAVPNPFDASITLDRIRTHVATWPSKQLADAAFAVQLDRYLAAAADAYRRNQLKAGKEHLAAIHEMLEKEHKHLDGDEDEAGEKSEHKPTARPNIDRLAARVLDFDLKYVLKRMERDEDERNKK